MVCRLPRSGAGPLRCLRRSELRRRQPQDRARRHHLHRVPCHDGPSRHDRQRRLHARGTGPLPLRQERQPALAVGKPAAGEGQAGLPQADVPQAVPQDGRVLRRLPQGEHPGRAEPLQGVPPRPEPLRHVPAQRRVGPRGAELLLPAAGEGELRRLPHARPAGE